MKIFKTLLIAVAAAAMSPAASAQQAAEPDSLVRALATFVAGPTQAVISDFEKGGIAIDRTALVDAFARALAGESTGFSQASAAEYLSSRLPSVSSSDTLDPQAEQAFVDSIAALDGAVTTSTGVVFQVLSEGQGDHPTLSDTVEVRYVGCLSNGSDFSSSLEPVRFRVSDVVPGFSEGLMMMRPGGQYRVVFPAMLGYGPDGVNGSIPGNAALDFTVELVAVNP